MNFFKDLSIRYKLLLIALTPLIIALIFILNGVLKNYQVLSAMHKAQKLGILATTASQLVHQLQKERGFSAGYLGSKGRQFSTALNTQHNETDLQLNKYHFIICVNALASKLFPWVKPLVITPQRMPYC